MSEKINLNHINQLELDTLEFQQFYSDIKNNDLILRYEDSDLDINKYVEVVTDLLTLEFNQRKLINFLYKSLIRKYQLKELFGELIQINESSLRLINKVNDNEFHLSINEEFNLEDLLKMYDVKFKMSQYGLIERLETYINLLAELTPIKCIFIFNQKHILTEEQVNNIEIFSAILKIKIIWINVVPHQENLVTKQLKEYDIINV